MIGYSSSKRRYSGIQLEPQDSTRNFILLHLSVPWHTSCVLSHFRNLFRPKPWVFITKHICPKPRQRKAKGRLGLMCWRWTETTGFSSPNTYAQIIGFWIWVLSESKGETMKMKNLKIETLK